MSPHKNAFTLLEMLLVLSVQMIILSAAVSPAAHFLQKEKEKNFFKALTADIYLAQVNAITHKEATALSFSTEKISVQTEKRLLLEQVYPPNLILQSRPVRYVFAPETGQINRFSTVIFIGKYTKKTKLVFQLGKGRFYIE